MPSKNGKAKLSHFKPQTRNANKGNQVGIRELDKSIRRDGYSAPMVAAADGEVFAGSKRLERAADVFGLDVEPLIIRSKGDRPVIHIREDIPNASDPRAVRLGVADNAIASADWNPDGEVLVLLAAEDAAIAELVRADVRAANAIFAFNPNGVDYQKEWEGMPEFEQKDIRGDAITCIVRFLTEDDRKKFEKFIGYKMAHKGNIYSAWWPRHDFDQLGRALLITNEP